MKADPRADMDVSERRFAGRSVSAVAERSGTTDGLVLTAGILGVFMIGAVTMSGLDAGRSDVAALPPPPQPAVVVAAEPPPVIVPPVIAVAAPAAPAAEVGIPEDRARAPAMILDLLAAEAPIDAAAAATSTPAAATANEGALNSDEQFAARLGPSGEEAVRAVALTNPSATIIQGTIISGVLETAIDTSLPGYARALVSRDVRSFDGSRILVPQGSRLIGRYRSSVATGQTRAYIIWTRLIRPDGVWVELASPATDEVGQTGLEGDVDTHFFERFGSSMILSIVGSVTTALTSTADVVISSTSDAQSAASAAMKSNADIPPTITIPQGEPIRIFIARDLDFSGAP